VETPQPALLLHSRPFRDNSLLVELFIPDSGRLGAVVRGVGGQRRSGAARRALLQPFQPLWASWSGRGELKTVQLLEARAAPLPLQGRALFSGLYLNELLCRLLQREDPHPDLFADYEQALAQLVAGEPLDLVLRRFELRLLEALGYGFSLVVDADGEAVSATAFYGFDGETGLRRLAGASPQALSGADLLDFAAGRFTEASRRALKRLCRLALRPHLGERPLQSRQLFGDN
jgi:DNA repair protein RecO (recombination protein O)